VAPAPALGNAVLLEPDPRTAVSGGVVIARVSDEPNAPFGGVKASATGSRFGGAAANIEAFTETQWVTVRPDIADYPFCPRSSAP
jgi:acyl-CoA reductase-like NAD-dependent aldehyde dehydrogenase